VFQNRLRKKMRIQSDPTIIYGLVGGKGALDHPIQQEEIDRETAYNTYKINGLPPTPIANPGRAAIEAVLRPAKTNDLYFVADGSGGHAFAPTLEAHNKNVAGWRKIEREIRAREAAEAAAKAAQEAAAGGATGAAPEGTAAAGTLQAQGAPGETGAATATGADPTTPPEVLIDPEALGDGANPFGDPEATGSEAVPAPLRNPNR
jgi:UPF0755 protein